MTTWTWDWHLKCIWGEVSFVGSHTISRECTLGQILGHLADVPELSGVWKPRHTPTFGIEKCWKYWVGGIKEKGGCEVSFTRCKWKTLKSQSLFFFLRNQAKFIGSYPPPLLSANLWGRLFYMMNNGDMSYLLSLGSLKAVQKFTYETTYLLLDVINSMSYISPYVSPSLHGPTTLPNQKNQLSNWICEIVQLKCWEKWRCSAGIWRRQDLSAFLRYICESLPDGPYTVARLVSVISLMVRVFQWLQKESMHYLCDSLFTFTNLSHKEGQDWAKGTYYLYWPELN